MQTEEKSTFPSHESTSPLSDDENFKLYKRFKECSEHNLHLTKEFEKLIDQKYDIILEISSIQRGEIFEKQIPSMKEETIAPQISEYDPKEAWLMFFSKAARENVALLKRINELKEELEELTDERNKLAAQAEHKSALGGKKKFKGLPAQSQKVGSLTNPGNQGTQPLYERVRPEERRGNVNNNAGEMGLGMNNLDRAPFNPFGAGHNGQGRPDMFKGYENQQGGRWFSKY